MVLKKHLGWRMVIVLTLAGSVISPTQSAAAAQVSTGRLLALVVSPGPASMGSDVTLEGSGPNDLISINTSSGSTSTIGSDLPQGFTDFAATLDSANNRLFYRDAAGSIVGVNTATGSVLSTFNVTQDVAALDFSGSNAYLARSHSFAHHSSLQATQRGKRQLSFAEPKG